MAGVGSLLFPGTMSVSNLPAPDISILLPCYNEEGFISRSVESMLSQEVSGRSIEVLVIDGMSTDATRAELDTIDDPRLRVIDNPDKTVPYALQRGLEVARGEFIFRADAHADYPDDYISQLLPYLHTDELLNVGGIIRTIPSSDAPVAQAIALALNSRFGVGSSFRTFKGLTPREAETVPFGAWRRSTIDAVGGFDTDFTRAQDLEFNARLKLLGGRVLCIPSVIIDYFSRPSYAKLAGMSNQYGYWKVLVNAKHRRLSTIRQLFPVALVTSVAVGLLGTAIWPGLWPLLLAPLYSYTALSIAVSIRKAIKARKIHLFPAVILAFAVAHFVYGYGYLRGLLNTYLLRRHEWTRVSRVTR